MTAENELIFHGGLLRCCVETLEDRTEPAKEGERQPCKYCSSGAVFHEFIDERTRRARPNAVGAWHWEGPS